MRRYLITAALVTLMGASGCMGRHAAGVDSHPGSPKPQVSAGDAQILTVRAGPALIDASGAEKAVRERANLAMQALQASDGTRLAELAHPIKGVRFSPHAFVHLGQDGDMTFKAAQLRELGSDATAYRWGTQDGTGRPIELTLAGYVKRFATRDYVATAQVGYNVVIKQGNTKVNTHEAYPDGIFVEYHLPGTGEHADFTWSSVRLVFEQENDVWYLVGVINDQWTI